MSSFPHRSKSRISPSEVLVNVRRLLPEKAVTRKEILLKSPVAVPPDPGEQFPVCVEALHEANDLIFMTQEVHTRQGDRTQPSNRRYVRTAKEWGAKWNPEKLDAYCHGLGAFMAVNPVWGKCALGYTFGDADVARFEYVLIESDVIPLEFQLGLLACLPIPIVALIDSGGKSIHAIVRVGATDAVDYKQKVAILYECLVKVGADPNTKNPGRLTRLPGAMRRTHNGDLRRQELLFLNPEAEDTPILDL